MAKTCLRTIEEDLKIRIGRCDRASARLNERIDASRKYETQRAAVLSERARLVAMLLLETSSEATQPALFDVARHMDAGAQILADNETGDAELAEAREACALTDELRAKR